MTRRARVEDGRHWQEALKRIERGDAAGVVAYLLPLAEEERTPLAPLALRSYREASKEMFERAWMEVQATGQGSFGSTVVSAAGAAALACATFAQLKRPWPRAPTSLELEIFAVRRPRWINQWLEHSCDRTWNGSCDWEVLDSLVASGLASITPRLVVALPATLRDNAPKDIPLDVLIEQRAWLREAVWLLFEIEGKGSSSLASCDRYSPRTSVRTFDQVFVVCARRGVLDRQRLLDASLGALTRGFSAFRESWFTHFHERLGPTPAERAARADRYFALLGSRNGATVSFALTAIGVLAAEGPVPAAEIAAALRAAPEPAAAGTRKRAAALLRRAERAAS